MSIHRYVYAENAPTNNFDPSGQVNVGDWDNPNQPEDGYSYQPDAFYALIEREVISLYQRDRGIYEAGVVLGGSPHYAENSQLFLPSQLFEGGWQGTLAEMQSLPQRPSPAWYQFYIPDLFDTQNYLFASVKPASQFLKGQSDIGRYTTAYSSPNLRSEGWGFSPLTDWPSRPYVINIGTGTNFTIENRSNSGVIVYYLGPTDEPAPEPCYDWVGDPAVDLCILQAFATRARILGTIRAPVAAGTTVVGGEKSSRSQFSVGLACIFAMFGMF